MKINKTFIIAVNTLFSSRAVVSLNRLRYLRRGTLLAALSTLTPSASTISIGVVAVALQSCEFLSNDDIDSNGLTEEQKLFKSAFDPTHPKLVAKGWVKESILDGKPVVCVPVSPKPNNEAFTEAFKNFMDIEIRLIDAKAGSYSITPVINKSSVEKVLKLSEELEPNKPFYWMSIVNQALKGETKRDLTPGVELVDRDDNNPSTPAPYLAQLPNRFTIEDIAKFNSFNTIKTNTFTMKKDESYRMVIGVSTIGKEFDAIYFPINPSLEAQSIVNQTGN